MKDYSTPEIPNSETDTKGQEAYRTIKDWIRSVPETLEEIKKMEVKRIFKIINVKLIWF